MGQCKLCNNNDNLCDSHILPKFFFKWLKETSATELLRIADNPNKPVQDGIKRKLFCKDCEERFSKLETYFLNTFFHPYINDYLDEFMAETTKVDPIYYDERLLKFIISLQWRILITAKSNYQTNNEKFNVILTKKIEVWRKYLMGDRKDTGIGKTHMLFLRNLINGKGYIHQDISPNINRYLLRASDGTMVKSDKKLFIFSKLGPFTFFTFLLPENIKDYHNTIVRRKGKISPVQKLLNPSINQFLFFDRPKKTDSCFEFSKKQKKKIETRWLANEERSLNSTTFKIAETDRMMSKIKQNSSDEN